MLWARANLVGQLGCLALLVILLVTSCSGDKARTRQSAIPTTSPSAATSTPVSGDAGTTGVTGLFTEPRRREANKQVRAAPRPPSAFKPWDRESVVLYDVESMTELNLGKGYAISFSPDGTKLAMNPATGQGPSGSVRVIDLATMSSEEFESTGGLASFADDGHLYLPGPGEVRVLDIRTGEVVALRQVTDPLLKAKVQRRVTASGQLTVDERYRLIRESYRSDDPCRTRPADEQEICRADVFEQWTIEEVATGRIVRDLRAYQLVPGGPGEVVIATSPQCQGADGSLEWCAEMLKELRADDPAGAFLIEYVTGTSNIFTVDIATGNAKFVATAMYAANTRVSPSNWPLIADEGHIVWTDSYCGQERGHTFVFDRANTQLTELDTGFWVRFTPDGSLGVDEFGPRAILDIRTFEWRVALPENTVDIVQSPDGRYLAVGGVLGHGGLCG